MPKQNRKYNGENPMHDKTVNPAISFIQTHCRITSKKSMHKKVADEKIKNVLLANYSVFCKVWTAMYTIEWGKTLKYRIWYLVILERDIPKEKLAPCSPNFAVQVAEIFDSQLLSIFSNSNLIGNVSKKYHQNKMKMRKS